MSACPPSNVPIYWRPKGTFEWRLAWATAENLRERLFRMGRFAGDRYGQIVDYTEIEWRPGS